MSHHLCIRKFRVFCVGIGLVLLLAGCVQVDEWTSIAASGTTTVHTLVRVAMGKPFSTKDLLKGNPFENAKALEQEGITITEQSNRMQRGQMLMHLAMQAPGLHHFAHMAKLLAATEKPAAADPMTPDVMQAMRESTFFHVRVKGARIRIAREFAKMKVPKMSGAHAAKGARKNKTSELDIFGGGDMADMMLSGFALRYGLSLPSAVLASNADLADGNTAQWAFPITAMQHEKIVLWAEIANTPENRAALFK